ncbi:MAG: hypothetical protein U0163_02070 [Gemmatimonadaceae bacterium]
MSKRPVLRARAIGACYGGTCSQRRRAAIVATTLGVGNAILLESGLAFLGLGVQPPHPSWGNMIAGGRDLIVTAPWVAIAPGLILVVTVLATTVLGDDLRDMLAGERVDVLGDRT